MANFPTTIPPDPVEIIAYCRWWLANLPTSMMSDADMEVIVNMNIAKYPDNLCKITYYSMLDILRWLIRNTAKGSAGSVGSGSVSRIKETIGKRTKELYYDVGTSTGEASGWDKVLEDLLADPSTIGCNPIDQSTTNNSGSVIIGGVSQKQYDKVATNSDSRNGWSMGSVCDRRKYRGWS